MKSGVIRRIDDLGRVTIPKEMRRKFNINFDDPLEIYVENGVICICKYETEEEIEE